MDKIHNGQNGINHTKATQIGPAAPQVDQELKISDATRAEDILEKIQIATCGAESSTQISNSITHPYSRSCLYSFLWNVSICCPFVFFGQDIRSHVC